MDRINVPICAQCQKEFPIIDTQIRAQDKAGNIRATHGLCPRHAIAQVQSIPNLPLEKFEDYKRRILQNKNSLPDLAQHPELIKAYSHGIFTREQANQAQQQMALKESLKKRANIKS